jgi:tetratricopeptide (TPR) repeat protein
MLAIGAFVYALLPTSIAYTHWMVTEDGLQHKEESFFALKRPHDLVAFLRQKNEGDRLENVRRKLLKQKQRIDANRPLYADDRLITEESFMKGDPSCRAAGQSLNQLDLYISTVLPLENKGIKTEDHVGSVPLNSRSLQPNCTAKPLRFSIHSFEHLDGVAKRDVLPTAPEAALKSVLPLAENTVEFGLRISTALKKNQTSWVLLNLAAFYWRIKGQPKNAIECLRRALEYSPRHHRDIAMVSLGNILHRTRHHKDAVVVLEAALEISPDLNVIHFTLGNIYAHIGEYNKAEKCFEHTAKLKPFFEAARVRLHAVRCQRELEQTLDNQQNLLERALHELESYKDEFEAFNARHEVLLKMLPTEQERNDQLRFYNEFKDRHYSPFSNSDLSVRPSTTLGLDSTLNISYDNDPFLSEVMVKPLTVVKEDLVRLKKSKHGELGEGDIDEMTGHSEQAITEDDIVKASDQITKKDPKDPITSKKNASVEGPKMKCQTVSKPETEGKDSAKKTKKGKAKKSTKASNNQPVINKITDQTRPDPAPKQCSQEPVCGDWFVEPSPDGPAMKAYKKVIAEEQQKLKEQAKAKQSTKTEVKTKDKEAKPKSTTDKSDTKTENKPAKSEPKRKGPVIDCPSCIPYDELEIFNEVLERVHGKRNDESNTKEETSNVEPKDTKQSSRESTKPAVESKKEPNVEQDKESTEKPEESNNNKPRIRLRLVKLNESDKNSPRSIRIEVANVDGKFPDDDADMSQFTDTDIEDLPVPLLHPAPPPEDEYGNVETPKVPPVQYKLFQNEQEMEVFKTLIKQDNSIEVIEEGFENEEEVDMIDGKRVIDRNFERAITEDGTVYENKYAPRLTLNPPYTHQCSRGRGLECVSGTEGEEAEHKMRIRIQQLQYHIDKSVDKPAEYGVVLEPDHHIYSLTYVSTANNLRYRMPRRRSLDELRSVMEPDYSARPQLAIPYTSQRHMNESREAARERRAHSQDRVERIPTEVRQPKTRQFDRDTLVPAYNPDDALAPIPSELNDCLEYFQHTPTFDDYPSTYLGPEARGANVSHLLTDGLSHGNMHQSPWTVPVCHDFADLPFSMSAFDHLVGVQYRENLAFLPEPQIKPVLIGMLDPDAPLEEVGQRILTAFECAEDHDRPQDKWVLFNIAALFFRAIGNPYHAVECVRRALHFSPLHAKDVALIQLANILRRFGHVSDAAVVMRMALEQHPDEAISHLNMATIYAAKGLRREAEAHAGFALQLQPNFSLAKRLHNATICSRLFPDDEKQIHGELQEALMRRQIAEGKEPTGRPEIKCSSSDCKPTISPITKHYSIATTIATTLAPFELPEYHYKDNPAMKPYLKRWEREEIKAGNRTAPKPVVNEMSIVIKPEKLLVFRYDTDLARGRPIIAEGAHTYYSSTLMVSAHAPFAGQADIQKDNRPVNIIHWAVCDYAPIPLNKDGTWKIDGKEVKAKRKHPHAGKIRDHLIWPSLTECGKMDLVNVWTLISIWVSPELKGFSLRKHIEFDEIFDTSMAWELPVCSVELPNNPFTMDHLTAMQYRQVFHTFNYSAEIGMMEPLKSISGSKSVNMDEIAVRLSLALAKNASNWIVLNVAALYWRVTGNATRAVQCLRAALYFSPRQHKDIALSGLASVFIRTGFFDDAVTVLQLANEIAPEVIVNHFSMGNALAILGYYEDAVLYYESTLLYQQDFPPAKTRLKTVRCMFMNHYLSQLDQDLLSGSIGLKQFKSIYRREDVPLVDPDIVEWVMNDEPLPVEKKPLCLLSSVDRYC